MWGLLNTTRLKQWNRYWQQQWQHWWHTLLLFRPVVKRVRLGVGATPVHWVSPVQVTARGLTFKQRVATYSTPLLLAKNATTALPLLGNQVVANNGLAAITQPPKGYATPLLPNRALYQSVHLRLPRPRCNVHHLLGRYNVAAKLWRWQPFVPPAAFRLKRLAVLPPAAKRIQPVTEKTRTHANPTRVWKTTIRRHPVPAHRFPLSVRNVFRKALAKQAGVAEAQANTILLTTVVDRIPGARIAHLNLHDDGAVSYRLKQPSPGVGGKAKQAPTGVVVVGRNLQTRQTIRAFVPAALYLDES